MLTFNDMTVLKKLFQDNQNIIQYIKSNTTLDAEEAILHSYDLQSGSYIQELLDQTQKNHKIEVGEKLAKIVKSLSVNAICEAGVGEATTLGHLLPFIDVRQKWGFDISMSRLLYGQKFLNQHNLNATLFCAELSHIPFADNSIECVYTFHSIEPNGGKEKKLLNELLRVTQKYLILIEPDYDLFGDEQKARMNQHDYCKHLYQYLTEMKMNVIHYEPWELDSYHLNKASITIVEKAKADKNFSDEAHFVSPISYQPVEQVSEGYFCKADGFLFPMIKSIPVFLRKNAVLVSHYDQIQRGEK